MIVDLNLKVKSLKDKLLWFNGNTNHFLVEFADDGAPESKKKTMTIATISLWNYGSRIRSREFHYPLHMELLVRRMKYVNFFGSNTVRK